MNSKGKQIYQCPACKGILPRPVVYCYLCNTYVNIRNNSYITSIEKEATIPKRIRKENKNGMDSAE